MTIALSQEVGRRLRTAGWMRHRGTDREGKRQWSYRHCVLLTRSSVEDAVRDLLDQRTIAFYRRKSDATSAGSHEHALGAIIEAVKVVDPVPVDYDNRRCVVIPIELWEAITALVPRAG